MLSTDQITNEYYIGNSLDSLNQTTHIIHWVTNYTAHIRGRVQLHCQTTHPHTVMAVWFRGQAEVDQTLVSNGTLTIATVSRSDEGKYSCIAMDTNGVVDSRTTTLTVLGGCGLHSVSSWTFSTTGLWSLLLYKICSCKLSAGFYCLCNGHAMHGGEPEWEVKVHTLWVTSRGNFHPYVTKSTKIGQNHCFWQEQRRDLSSCCKLVQMTIVVHAPH